MPLLARLSLPVLLLLTTACQSFSGLEAPEVSLSSLRLSGSMQLASAVQGVQGVRLR